MCMWPPVTSGSMGWQPLSNWSRHIFAAGSADASCASHSPLVWGSYTATSPFFGRKAPRDEKTGTTRSRALTAQVRALRDNAASSQFAKSAARLAEIVWFASVARRAHAVSYSARTKRGNA